LPITDDWDGRIDDVDAIRLGVENVNNIRNANREEAWSNPWAITPQRGRITAGATLTFTNTTQVAHTLKARDGSWSAGTIAPGQSATVTVSKPGKYDYVCQEHPWSIGQLIVQ
jgi:plastocyanin